MRVLGLDMSFHTGWAILDDGKLVGYGRFDAENVSFKNVVDDYRILSRAYATVSAISALIEEYGPDQIYVEQTNAGSFRTAQKGLEFCHCLLLYRFFPVSEESEKLNYVDTSAWRKKLNLRLTKEQRLHNKLVKAKKAKGKITPKHLAVEWANKTFGLELKLCENDIADALALAMYGHKDGLEKPSRIAVKNVAEDLIKDMFSPVGDSKMVGLSEGLK